jgi:hypothetical protein
MEIGLVSEEIHRYDCRRGALNVILTGFMFDEMKLIENYRELSKIVGEIGRFGR